jgi:PKD repeat protein
MKLKTLYILLVLFGFFQNLIAQIPAGNLKLWLCADSVLLNSEKVTQWYDLSLNEFNIIQTEIDYMPLKEDSVINNFPVITFDGVNDYLDGGNIINLETNSHSIFIVAKGDRTILAKSIASDSPNRYSVLLHTNSLELLYSDNGNRSLNYNNANFLNNSFNLFSVQNDRQNNFNKCFINSELVVEGVINGSYNVVSDFNFLIGAHNNSSGYIPPFVHSLYGYLNGSIAEIIIYDVLLSDIDRIAVENYLMNKYSTLIDLGEDIIVEYGFCDTILTINQGFTEILWSTGATDDTIYVNETGEYWVQARDLFGRVKSDTINIEFPNPNIQNSSICLGDSVLYEPTLIGSYDYLWSDLSTGASKYFKDEGDYWLRIEDDLGCFDTVFFSVEVDSFKNLIWLGNDTTLCSGNTLRLIEGEELCTSFLWTPGGNTDPAQIVDIEGWYKVEVQNDNSCVALDSVYVTIMGIAPTPAYFVENLCFGENTQFVDNSTPIGDIVSWQWIINNNDTLFTQNAEYEFSSVGFQQIELIIEASSGCVNSSLFELEILEVPVVAFSHYEVCTGFSLDFVPEIELPTGSVITSYTWTVDSEFVGDSEILTYTFPSSQTYTVKLEVEINNGCKGICEKQVDVNDEYPLPLEFSLVYPNNNFIITDEDSITFEWNLSENVIFYLLEISSDILFNDILLSEQVLDNQYSYDLPSLADTLFWRVYAYNTCLDYSLSETSCLYKFNPNSYNNLQLWLVADSVNTIDDFVLEWYDLSENEFHLTQSEESRRPIFVDSVINNYPVIRFNGTSSKLATEFETICPQPNTIFIVYKISGLSYNQVILDALTTNRSILQFYINKLKLKSMTDDIVEYTLSVPTPFLLNTLIYNSPDSKLYDFATLKSEGNSGSLGFDGFCLGSTQDNQAFFEGDIAEVLFYDGVLNTASVRHIQQYLYTKYFDYPPVNLLYDIRIPYGFCDTAITTAYKPWFTSYEWSTGETDSVIHVNRPGLYSVTVTDIFGFESSDDIRIFYPSVNNFADTIACYGSFVVWDAEITGDYTYQWYGSSETTQAITITDEGQYAVIVSDTLGCQYISDTIDFSWDNYEFTASLGPYDTVLCVGNRLMLVSNADETVSYQWSTGSTDSQIVLLTNNTYAVTVSNVNGCTATDFINVFLHGTVPNPDFSTSGQCDGQIIYFTDLSTAPEGTINEWQWKINGQQFSTEQNPNLQHGVQPDFQEPGTYSVTLTVNTDDGCGDFVILPLTIYPLPQVAFMPNYFCQYADINFISVSTVENGNILNNYWDFGTETAEGPYTFHTFNEAGLQTVELVSLSDAFCSDTLVAVINVKPAELPQYTVENACQGNEAFFINTTPPNPIVLAKNWIWNFGDGATDTISNPVHIYNSSGIFNTEVTVTFQNGCVVNAEQTVEIYSRPEVDIYSTNECAGRAFSPDSEVSTLSGEITGYKWTLEDSIQKVSLLQNPEFVINNPGYYLLELEATTSYGCRYSDEEYIIVHANPLTDFDVTDTWGAVPFQIDFTNNSTNAVTYLWDFGTGDVSTDKNPYYIYADSGTYVVRLISYSAFGCTDTAEISIRSVIPLMDVVLYDLRNTITGNYMHSKVYIINNGTLPVNNLDILLNLGDGKVYREVIEYLAPWQVIDYSFTVEVYLADAEMPELVCAEAAPPAWEGYTDINTENNIVCNTDVEKFKVLRPYPNPTKDNLNFEIITSESQNLDILLINGIGETVYQKNITNHIGYSRQTITTSVFSNGMYYLRIIGPESSQNFKIEVAK